jgi:hypothetical protein
MYLKFVVYNDTNINKEKLEKLKKVYSEEWGYILNQFYSTINRRN